jgi:hypothetical protein
MDDAIIDKIYADTLNMEFESFSRLEQIKRYIELYLESLGE